ncbi:uncharacterized protein LOC5510222 [Nematostella vectensis]|uniref:uncharacterized protein LOC5510222 n=1 Tax=Nematostella vectensis TaxID=45351 RepID=UPI0020773331|nr:uncharacterized protein LOC5510222 [Nematostella vectensis]
MMKVVAAFAIYIAVVFSHPPGPKKPEISVSRVGPVMEDKRGLDGRRSLLKSKLDLFRRLEECAQPDIYGCVQWEQQGLCTNATYQAFMETKCGAACGLCTAPAPPPPSAETVDVSSCLGRHNTKRGLHQGLIPSYSMTWDSTLASAAETWALQLINDDVDNNVAMTTLNLVHSSPNGQYGENLYGSVSLVRVFDLYLKL